MSYLVVKIDIMLTYDTVFEITSSADASYFNNLCSNPLSYTYANKTTTIANWFVSRIKRNRDNMPESDYRVNNEKIIYLK